MIISLARPLPLDVGRVTQHFGEHPEWYERFEMVGHNGTDYGVPEGTAVLAAHSGVCTVDSDPEGYGLFVKVTGPDYVTIYAHLRAVRVVDGQPVTRGEQIGESGNSGNSTGPHLHWGLRVNGMRNPAYRGWIDTVPFRDV